MAHYKVNEGSDGYYQLSMIQTLGDGRRVTFVEKGLDPLALKIAASDAALKAKGNRPVVQNAQ